MTREIRTCARSVPGLTYAHRHTRWPVAGPQRPPPPKPGGQVAMCDVQVPAVRSPRYTICPSASRGQIYPRRVPRKFTRLSRGIPNCFHDSGSGDARSPCIVGAHPDIPLVHEFDLPGCHLTAIFIVPVRGVIEINILRVDRLFVNKLVLLCGEVFDPVVPLCIRAEPAERLDVDSPRDPGRPAAVVVPPDNLPAVVDHGCSPTESVDRDIGIGMQVVCADIARDQV